MIEERKITVQEIKDEIDDWCGKFRPELRDTIEASAWHIINWMTTRAAYELSTINDKGERENSKLLIITK